MFLIEVDIFVGDGQGGEMINPYRKEVSCEVSVVSVQFCGIERAGVSMLPDETIEEV